MDSCHRMYAIHNRQAERALVQCARSRSAAEPTPADRSAPRPVAHCTSRMRAGHTQPHSIAHAGAITHTHEDKQRGDRLLTTATIRRMISQRRCVILPPPDSDGTDPSNALATRHQSLHNVAQCQRWKLCVAHSDSPRSWSIDGALDHAARSLHAADDERMGGVIAYGCCHPLANAVRRHGCGLMAKQCAHLRCDHAPPCIQTHAQRQPRPNRFHNHRTRLHRAALQTVSLRTHLTALIASFSWQPLLRQWQRRLSLQHRRPNQHHVRIHHCRGDQRLHGAAGRAQQSRMLFRC